MILKLFVVYVCMYQLLNGQLAELPTMFDSFFTDYTNTTSITVGVNGGGWGATK